MFGAQKTGSPTHLMSHTYEAMFFWLGRTLARIDPMYGASAGAPAWPARLLCIASKWLLMLPGWVIDRMSANRLVSFAIRLCNSLIRMPGTAVAIGLYGPRISSGAFGLRSQVSRWLGPPHRRMKMHDFSAVPFGESVPTRAATRPGVARL